MTQPELDLSHRPHFDGADLIPSRDYDRMKGQILRVFNLIKDGKWRTLEEISNATGDPHASVSTRLRDFRKKRFGGFTINKKYIKNGLYKYSMDIGIDE